VIRCLRSHLEHRIAERGYTLQEVRRCITGEEGEYLLVDTEHPAYPKHSKPGFVPSFSLPLAIHGPGTELHALLRDWLGIEPTADCPCRSMAGKMDSLGPDWCESDEGMTEILGVMRTEHGKRWADGRTILPWTDMGARQLVLLACRRARAKAEG